MAFPTLGAAWRLRALLAPLTRHCLLACAILLAGLVAPSWALTLSNTKPAIGAPVLVTDVNPSHFYSVFWINLDGPKSDPCAHMSGEELAADNDLTHYGTCFVNDGGTFQVVELSEDFSGNYNDSVQSSVYVAKQNVVMGGYLFSFTLATDGNKSISPGQTATVQVSATLSTGSAGSVVFDLLGIPDGSRAALLPSSCTPTCTAVLSVVTDATVQPGAYPITVHASGAGAQAQSAAFTLTVQRSLTSQFRVEAANGGDIGTQRAGAPFGLRITAQYPDNSTDTAFTGPVQLTTTAGTITPATSGAFVGGVRLETVTVTAPGSAQTITAAASGAAGVSNAFTVTDGAPDTVLDSWPAALVLDRVASFTFRATDAGSTFACQLDAGAWSACTSPSSVSGLADGSHTYRVRATNPAGYTDQTPATATWTVDATAPDTAIDAAPASPSSDAAPVIRFSASERASFACQLDGGGFAPCASPVTLTGLRPGSHTFQVRAVDEAGNADPTPAAVTWLFQRTVTATVTVASKVYDGGTAATVTGCVLTGVDSQDAALVGCSSTATFTAAAAGRGIAITATLSLTGSLAGNYTVTSPVTVAADITPRGATLRVADATKSYGAEDPGFSVSQVGILPADLAGLTLGASRTTGESVGTYVLTPIATGTGAANYEITVVPGTFTITQVASAARSSVTVSPAAVPSDGVMPALVTVTLRDAYGNPVGGKVVSLGQASGPGVPVLTVLQGTTDAAGVALFAARSTTAGVVAFSAAVVTDTVTLTQGASVTFLPGAAARIVFAQGPATTAAGAALAPVTVQLLDANGNLAAGDNTTIVSLALAAHPSGGTLSGGAAARVTGGTATFGGLSIDQAGVSYGMRASVSGLAAVSAAPFDITGLTVSPDDAVFAPWLPAIVGVTTPMTRQLTLRYAGDGPMTVSSIDVTGDDAFRYESDTCRPGVISGASCSVTLGFAPSPAYLPTVARAGQLVVTHDKASSPQALDLSGSRTPWEPFTLDVGSVAVGTTGTQKTFTINNVGRDSIQTGERAVSLPDGGPFALATDTCANRTLVPYDASSPDPAASCTVTLSFAPVEHAAPAGATTWATFTVSDVTGRALPLLVKGTGTYALLAAPGRLDFGNVARGTTGVTRTVTLTNPNGIDVTALSVGVSGAGYSRTTTCGSSLGAGLSCTVTVKFAPSTLGASAGRLLIASSADDTPSVPLSGVGSYSIAVSVSSLAFGNSAVGIPSTPRTVTLTNANSVPVPLSAIRITSGAPEYAVAGGTCATAVPAAGSCTVLVTFTPSSPGSRPGTLTIASDAAGSPHTIALSASGTFVLATGMSAMQFGNMPLLLTSTMQWVSLQNANGVPLPLTSIATGSREFVISGGTCGAAVPARVGTTNGSCVVQLTFTPESVGPRAATLTIQSAATNTPTVSLAGTGTQVLRAGLSAMQFGNTPVALTRGAQTVSLSNPSGAPIPVTSIMVGGSEFVITGHTCGAAVPARVNGVNGSCIVQLTFTPGAAGTRTGVLTILSGATNGTVTVSLAGTGTFTLATSVSTVQFGNVAVGQTSSAQTVTLINASGVAMALTGISAGGGEFLVAGGTCGSSVPPKVGSTNGTCTVMLTFRPSTAGRRAGALSIAGAATNRPATVTLSGTGF